MKVQRRRMKKTGSDDAAVAIKKMTETARQEFEKGRGEEEKGRFDVCSCICIAAEIARANSVREGWQEDAGETSNI